MEWEDDGRREVATGVRSRTNVPGDSRPVPVSRGGAHSRRSGAELPNRGTRRQCLAALPFIRRRARDERIGGRAFSGKTQTTDRSPIGGLRANGSVRRGMSLARAWSLDGQRRLDPAPASRLLANIKMDPGLRRDDGEVVWGASDFGPGDQGLNGSRGIGRVAAAMPGGIAVHPSTGSGRTDRGPGTSRKDTDYWQFTLRRVQDERIRDRASPGKTKTIGRSPIDGLGTSGSGTGHLEERPRLPTVHPSTGSGRMHPGLRISQTITNHRYRLFHDGPGTNRSRAECFQERLEPPISVRPEPVEG